MKKLFLIFTLILLFSFDIYSENICLISENNQICEYLQSFFPDEKYSIKMLSNDYDSDSLISGDKRFFEYLEKQSESDMIIIPIVENLSGFTHKRIFIYKDSNLQLAYESLNNREVDFQYDVILNLLPFITEEQLGLLTFESILPGTVVYIDSIPQVLHYNSVLIPEGNHTIVFNNQGYLSDEISVNVEKYKLNFLNMNYDIPLFHNLYVNCPVTAQVYNEGVLIGTTPFTIDSYSLPYVLRFHADGFIDRVISINEPTDSIDVNLNIIELSDPAVFKNNQNKFYRSFMRSLLLFGSISFVRGSMLLNSNATRTAENIIDGVLALSLADVGFDLFRYYKSIKNIAP